MQKRGMWKVWVLAVTLVVLSEFLVGFSAAEGTTEVLQVPILIYHDFAAEESDYTMSGERFRRQVEALVLLGYETVSFRQMLEYTDGAGELPEKPVILLSDDGYTGVLTTALPVLEEYDFCMSVAVIGELVGMDKGEHPHFSLEELAAADPGGRIELVSHSYGLHRMTEEMTGAVNLTMRAEEYEQLLRGDFAAMGELFAAEEVRAERQADTVHRLTEEVFVYPFGAYSPESEAILAELGVRVTVTTDIGVAEVAVGEGLTLLPRVMAEWMGK